MKTIKSKSNKKKTDGKILIDFPPELYNEMRKKVKQNGQTFKGYLTNLVAKDLGIELKYD